MRQWQLIVIGVIYSAFFIMGEGETQIPMGNADLDTCVTLIQKGNTEEAKNMLQNYRRTYPDDPRALFYLAQIEGDYDKTLALYGEVERLALRTDSEYADSSLAAETIFMRAEMMFSKGGYSEARTLYDRVIDEFPESGWYGDALYRLGVIELTSGDPELALPMFRGYLELYPEGDKRVLVNVGIMECYVKFKDWKNILVSAQDVLNERDENSAVTPRVLEVMAEASEKLEKKNDAALYREKLLATYPESFQVYVLRAKEGGEELHEISLGDVSPLPQPKEQGKAGEGQTSDNIPSLSQESAREIKGGFTVQASAFEIYSNALAMFTRLKDANIDARIDMKNVDGKQFYKVLVGSYRTREEAEAMVNRVTNTTGIKAYVVILE